MAMILAKRRLKVNMSGPQECSDLRMFDVLHQTRKTVFDYISKHREAKRVEFSTRSELFLMNLEMFENLIALS